MSSPFIGEGDPGIATTRFSMTLMTALGRWTAAVTNQVIVRWSSFFLPSRLGGQRRSELGNF